MQTAPAPEQAEAAPSPAPTAAAPEAAPAAPTPTPAPATPPAEPAPPAAPAAPEPQSESVADMDALLEKSYETNPTAPKIPHAVSLDPEPARPAALPVTPPAAPVTPTAPAPIPEPPTGQVPPVVEGTPQEKIIAGRISPQQFDETAQRAMVLHRELNNGRKPGDPGFIPLKDCIVKLEEMTTPQAPAAAPAPPQPSQLETLTAQRATFDEQLAAINTQLDDLAESGVEFGPEIRALQKNAQDLERQRADLAPKLERAEHEQKQQQQTEAQKRHTEARQRAVKLFPSAGDPQSPLGQETAALVREMQNPEHPNHALLYGTDAATYVATTAAQQLAERLATTQGGTVAQHLAALMAPAQPATQTTQTAAAPEPFRVLPATGGATTTSAPVAVPQTEKQLLDSVGDDWKKADELLDKGSKVFAIR